MSGRVIEPAALTLHDLVGLGTEVDLTQVPPALVQQAARKYLQNEARNRRRAEARRAEQRAYGDGADAIGTRVSAAAHEAASTAQVVWADILDVSVQVAGERVTWGTATIEDHELAATAAEVHGSGYVRLAAMHRAAILELQRKRVDNLVQATGWQR